MKRLWVVGVGICSLLAAAMAFAGEATPRLSRPDFNRLAVQNQLPLYWLEDATNPGQLDPAELHSTAGSADLGKYVQKGKFTYLFDRAYRQLQEARRIEAVKKEMDQGRVALLVSDFRDRPAEERKFVAAMVKVGSLIRELFLTQKGAGKMIGEIAHADYPSRGLFERNSGPWCEAPQTQDDPFCNASKRFVKKRSDAYPSDLEQDQALCEKLKQLPNGKELLDPFAVVRHKGDGFEALPLTKVYGPKMKEVAKQLRMAEKALPAAEAKQKAYLLAAAKAFETNNWPAADEIWAAMGGGDSRWYVRVAPDEVYFDPCQEKAGFQLSFATVDPAGLVWQKKLTPLREKMEDALAQLIGPSYQPRKVEFRLPDFIRIVLNAGESRSNLGATIGESLPNWGKVAQEGRGRTVVMTNFYTDPDSIAQRREKARSLFAEEAMAHYTDDATVFNLNTILHEAMHNFGPHSDYRIEGKTPSQVFGGRLASILEELKAQTGALWLIGYLKQAGVIDETMAQQAYIDALFWCFGHISRGMISGSGNPRVYSQLAAVQIGTFLREGAMGFEERLGAEGKKLGYFTVDLAKLPAAIDRLMAKVGQIKAQGEVKAGQELIDDFVKGEGSRAVRFDLVQERLNRYSKESFYYAVYY